MQLDVPLCQLFRCEVEAISLVGNVVVLAEHTPDRMNKLMCLLPTTKQADHNVGGIDTHRRLHPEKNTLPLPLCPCKHGSTTCQHPIHSATNTDSAVRHTLPEMWSDGIDLDRLSSDQTHASLFISIHTA